MSIPPLFYFLGVVAVVVVFALWRLFGSLNWSETEGVVLDSVVETIDHGQKGVRTTDVAFDYKVVIEYRYSVGGKEYVGSRLFATMPNIVQSSTVAENFVNQYKAGVETKIFYNPENPSESALIAGSKLPKTTLMIISFFVVFVLSVLGAAVHFFNKIF